MKWQFNLRFIPKSPISCSIYGLIISVLIIFALGLLMVFNTTSAEVLDRSLNQSTHYAFLKQICFALLSSAAALVVWFLGYEQILVSSKWILYGGIFLLALLFIPGIGHEINGAKRWISCCGFSFQPSEFMKYIIPIYLIHEVAKRGGTLNFLQFIRLFSIVAIPTGLILMEPDNGTAAIILVTLLVFLVISRIRLLYWLLPLLLIVAGGGALALRMSHVPDRIRIYLNPELDLRGKGHQPYQAKIAAGSGKLFGRGFGESLQKLDYLPEARSDYIAAIYAEELGFLGMVFLILLYMCVAYFGFSLAFHTSDPQGSSLIAIVTFLISFQAFLNFGVVSGLLPSKGINLPFFSLGGSSLLANFMGICLILNVARHAEKKYA
jgi:cell division protein FtsW